MLWTFSIINNIIKNMSNTACPSYILFGMKHSGKSTQGKLLAEKLSLAFVDIDEAITKQTNLSPRKIYMRYGPGKFMEAEEKFCSVLADKCFGKKIVISTGGGICDNAPAITLLRDLGKFIFLDVTEETLLNRILKHVTFKNDGTISNLPGFIAKKEPQSKDEVHSIFHDFYIERTNTYRQIADIIIPLDDSDISKSFAIICDTLSI